VITRFDHAVIAMRDLDDAVRRYRDLGFDVVVGGRHPEMGTHNAIIRFGLEYIELLAVADEAEAIASGAKGRVLVNFLRQRSGGLVGYAVAARHIEEDAERFRRTGLAAEGPFAMSRRRPDGNILSWRLLVPTGVAWRRTWPFLIEWDAPDDQRLAWEPPGVHPNGVTGVRSVAEAVSDLGWASDLYRRQLGLGPGDEDDAIDLGARRATFRLGTFRIDLLAPVADGVLAAVLAETGEGPFELTLTVRDRAEAAAILSRAGIPFEDVPIDPTTICVPLKAGLGARLVLTEQRGC
jgi:catechol 2,3-dioxygenase-like lactoylglutathione lyase family enzyme